MALIETIDPTDVNLALQNGIGAQLQWQIPQAELEHRLDAAAYAAAAILNAPFFEDDLTPTERAAAEDAYTRCLAGTSEVRVRPLPAAAHTGGQGRMTPYHAPDCGGGCDGCGYIGADNLWYPGECPTEAGPHQQERAEGL